MKDRIAKWIRENDERVIFATVLAVFACVAVGAYYAPGYTVIAIVVWWLLGELKS